MQMLRTLDTATVGRMDDVSPGEKILHASARSNEWRTLVVGSDDDARSIGNEGWHVGRPHEKKGAVLDVRAGSAWIRSCIDAAAGGRRQPFASVSHSDDRHASAKRRLQGKVFTTDPTARRSDASTTRTSTCPSSWRRRVRSRFHPRPSNLSTCLERRNSPRSTRFRFGARRGAGQKRRRRHVRRRETKRVVRAMLRPPGKGCDASRTRAAASARRRES